MLKSKLIFISEQGFKTDISVLNVFIIPPFLADKYLCHVSRVFTDA